MIAIACFLNDSACAESMDASEAAANAIVAVVKPKYEMEKMIKKLKNHLRLKTDLEVGVQKSTYIEDKSIISNMRISHAPIVEMRMIPMNPK